MPWRRYSCPTGPTIPPTRIRRAPQRTVPESQPPKDQGQALSGSTIITDPLADGERAQGGRSVRAPPSCLIDPNNHGFNARPSRVRPAMSHESRHGAAESPRGRLCRQQTVGVFGQQSASRLTASAHPAHVAIGAGPGERITATRTAPRPARYPPPSSLMPSTHAALSQMGRPRPDPAIAAPASSEAGCWLMATTWRSRRHGR